MKLTFLNLKSYILKEGSLQRNVFFMILGNGFFAFSQWVQLSVISKYTSIEILGFYTLALSIVSPIFMLSSLQLRTILVTDSKSEFNFNDFFNLRLITNLISLIVILGVLVFIHNKNILLITLILTCQKVFESFSELFNSKQQKIERIDILATSLFLKGLGAIISLFIGLFLFNSLTVGLSFIVISYLLVICFYDYRKYSVKQVGKIKILFNNSVLKKLFFRGLPLGIVMLIISLNANVSKYFLEAYVGTEAQAVYSSISYLLIVGVFILDAFGQAFVPRLNIYYWNKEAIKFKKLAFLFITGSFFIGLILYICSSLFGETILNLLFNKRIAQYASFLASYMLVSILIFIASSLGYVLTSIREFKIQPYINGTVLLFNLALSFLLIKSYGLDGTIIVLGICFSIQIIMTVIALFKGLKKNLS
ncbi:oligosaccharide flippase family protein [Elizabethkingia meningoseptica]|uniref:oligosaccharide flippase family protein n=1 Tax=Elizabethkingia meningoseptica TaxID=238 RepID=UPI0022F1D437|nr:oligosaccharide flippase family protein [Elizabethkingia meningoseptica]EJK5329524.1 oligosaccharide flippase family protein [Elizabethkingia meningoseptica]MDE5430530.1 oligosaccharide flippase family protein [Elizabethkingia meningoseptica]MDE5469364.1 oligosaccharide flippase family protein [Elizabethkingia meningoseptica]MDE5475278.1 oligosaccharide flippase family protein [Elizabethkingia meningoseptica]MDE5478711.1 oligosaccharide flippase family protein [Elizabethkingia meningoseptic